MLHTCHAFKTDLQRNLQLLINMRKSSMSAELHNQNLLRMGARAVYILKQIMHLTLWRLPVGLGSYVRLLIPSWYTGSLELCITLSVLWKVRLSIILELLIPLYFLAIVGD